MWAAAVAPLAAAVANSAEPPLCPKGTGLFRCLFCAAKQNFCFFSAVCVILRVYWYVPPHIPPLPGKKNSKKAERGCFAVYIPGGILPEEEAHDREDCCQKELTDQIIQTGSLTAEGGRHVIHCLTVVGQIEGHYILPPQNKTTKYEHVIPQLVAIEQDPAIKGLLIILNTVGGDVEAGLAIAELISGMRTPTVSLVLGGGHSIGVPLACSARRSLICPSATMTIHPVRMNGLVLCVPQSLSYIDQMQDRIIRFVTQNSKIKEAEFRRLMTNTGELVTDVGTILDGQRAVETGLIDRLGSLGDAVEELYRLIDEEAGEPQ